MNAVLADSVNHIDEVVSEKPLHVKYFDAIDYLKHKILFDLNEDKKESALAIFRVDGMKNIKNFGFSYEKRVPKTSLTVA